MYWVRNDNLCSQCKVVIFQIRAECIFEQKGYKREVHNSILNLGLQHCQNIFFFPIESIKSHNSDHAIDFPVIAQWMVSAMP